MADHGLTDFLQLDADAALNIYGSTPIFADDSTEADGKIKLYRGWLRLSADQYEIRVGLQKITFGPASLIRSLMWFDQIDPKDPQKLTQGVYALLGRYYFLNNANIWLWGLYGNEETKGWEVFPTADHTPEWGGRAQMPLLTGEAAVSYHHRRADVTDGVPGESNVPENRLGLDGKWDVGAGIWFEGTLIHKNTQASRLRYQTLLTLGADYTLDLGNGLTLLGEHFWGGTSKDLFRNARQTAVTAVSARYPYGMRDYFTLMGFYDWDRHRIYPFFDWQRQYDWITFHLMAFENPDTALVAGGTGDENVSAGKGVQVLLVWHH
jgi:hypothetical protein